MPLKCPLVTLTTFIVFMFVDTLLTKDSMSILSSSKVLLYSDKPRCSSMAERSSNSSPSSLGSSSTAGGLTAMFPCVMGAGTWWERQNLQLCVATLCFFSCWQMKHYCTYSIASIQLGYDLFGVSISSGYDWHGQCRGTIFLIWQQVKENQRTCQYKKEKQYSVGEKQGKKTKPVVLKLLNWFIT